MKAALLHHTGKDFYTQQRIYDEITVASALLDEPFTAFNEIDRVLDAVYWHKGPGYIELPRDMVRYAGDRSTNVPSTGDHQSDPEILRGRLSKCNCVHKSERKSCDFGRCGNPQIRLPKQITPACRRKTDFPVVTTLLGKSVMPEAHPLYLGIYGGAMSREEISSTR